MRHAFAALVLLLALIAGSAWATDSRLDHLFQQLGQAQDAAEGDRIAMAIVDIWNRPADEVTRELLEHGQSALFELDTKTALAAFDASIEREPNYAEGWNKRATLYYVMGEFDASIADIVQALRLEPRHFGALAGLGMVYDAQAHQQHALHAYRAALTINPYLNDVRKRAETLEREIAASRI